MSLSNRNVLALRLPASPVARPRVSRVAPDRKPAPSARPAVSPLSPYMQNLSPAVVQHHKTALNVYRKGVPVQPENRCKKCSGRGVECVKIKFPTGKESRKCALCAVTGGHCVYDAPDL